MMRTLLTIALLGAMSASSDAFLATGSHKVLPMRVGGRVLAAKASAAKTVCRASQEGNQASRREALTLGAAAAWLSLAKPALAYDFRNIKDGSSTYAVPEQWQEKAGELAGKYFADPVSGRTVENISVIRVSAGDKQLDSIQGLGKIESIKMSKQLGLPVELDRADMIDASRRKGKDGSVYYDFTLAVAPRTCSAGTEMLTGTCPYEAISLISAWAAGSSIVVLKIDATAAQWKVNGPLLKSLKKSFIAVL